jgi:hypothetical protein
MSRHRPTTSCTNVGLFAQRRLCRVLVNGLLPVVALLHPKMPTYIDEVPTYIDKMPTYIDKMPTYIDEVPTYIDEVPTYIDKMPTYIDKMPTYIDKMPTYIDKMPTYIDKMSSIDKILHCSCVAMHVAVHKRSVASSSRVHVKTDPIFTRHSSRTTRVVYLI